MAREAQSDSNRYLTDLLGEPFVSRTLTLANERDAEATLVRLGEPSQRHGLLYVHGYSDYFFQAEHALSLAREGELDFYALDLRRYGRSLRQRDLAGYVTDLSVYDEELSRALRIMREEGHDHLTLLGHSTGGLIATLYAYDHPREIDTLVLNSPWYDLNETPIRRRFAGPFASLVARADPNRVISSMQDHYAASIHRSTGGEWSFDLDLKPMLGFPVRAGWLRAIRRGQRRVEAGTPLPMPVLMCTSSRSGGVAGQVPTSSELSSTDCVLDVAHMWRAVPRLGRDVTLHTVPGGRHDLALSEPAARREYERVVTAWLNSRVSRP